MVDYVLDAARGAGVTRLILIVGHKADDVKQAMSQHADVEFALQAEQLGTGHAVMMCREQLQDYHGPVLVLAGDTPLLKAASLQGLLDDLRDNSAACVIGSAVTEANQGLGRIVRNADGNFERIVEERGRVPRTAGDYRNQHRLLRLRLPETAGRAGTDCGPRTCSRNTTSPTARPFC